MKNYAVFALIAVFGIASCGTNKTSNNLANNQINTIATPPISNNSNQILNNTNAANITNSEVTSDMMKQIEAQQKETADKTRSNANGNGNTKTTAPPKVKPPQNMTW